MVEDRIKALENKVAELEKALQERPVLNKDEIIREIFNRFSSKARDIGITS